MSEEKRVIVEFDLMCLHPCRVTVVVTDDRDDDYVEEIETMSMGNVMLTEAPDEIYDEDTLKEVLKQAREKSDE